MGRQRTVGGSRPRVCGSHGDGRRVSSTVAESERVVHPLPKRGTGLARCGRQRRDPVLLQRRPVLLPGQRCSGGPCDDDAVDRSNARDGNPTAVGHALSVDRQCADAGRRLCGGAHADPVLELERLGRWRQRFLFRRADARAAARSRRFGGRARRTAGMRRVGNMVRRGRRSVGGRVGRDAPRRPERLAESAGLFHGTAGRRTMAGALSVASAVVFAAMGLLRRRFRSRPHVGQQPRTGLAGRGGAVRIRRTAGHRRSPVEPRRVQSNEHRPRKWSGGALAGRIALAERNHRAGGLDSGDDELERVGSGVG